MVGIDRFQKQLKEYEQSVEQRLKRQNNYFYRLLVGLGVFVAVLVGAFILFI